MKEKKSRRWLIALPIVCAAVIITAVVAFILSWGWEDTSALQAKLDALKGQALADWVLEELGTAPAGQAGHAVFLSVSDVETRAQVFSATAPGPEEAWQKAQAQALASFRRSGKTPNWVRADLVYISNSVDSASLSQSAAEAGSGNFRYGIAFDPDFNTALLEAELNAWNAWDAQSGGLRLEALNSCLRASGRRPLKALPEEFQAFQCAAWFCDDSSTVRRLNASGQGYGNRQVEQVDGSYALALVLDASSALAGMLGEDGAFSPGSYAGLGQPLESVSLEGQARALEALAFAYTLTGNESLGERLDKSAEALAQAGPQETSGLALAAAALCRYQESRASDGEKDFRENCRELGEALLKKSQGSTGEEAGKAIYGLSKAYGILGDEKLLAGAQKLAKSLMSQSIPGEETCWAALGLNALATADPQNPNYYACILELGSQALEAPEEREGIQQLALLAAVSDSFARMEDHGGKAEGFDLSALKQGLAEAALAQSNSFCYPEQAMYMAAPEAAAGAFMRREDRFQISPEVLGENIEAFGLYWNQYERLLGQEEEPAE